MKRRGFFKWIKRIVVVILLVFVGIVGVTLYQTAKSIERIDRFKNEIHEQAEIYEIEEYTDIVYGIIITESKGKAVDIMQSSESLYGRRNLIDSEEESIQQGISYFAQAVQLAEAKDCDVWTAVQAYNYGLDYIDYVAKAGGENNQELAEEYSKEVLSPILGNQEQQRYRYWRWQSLVYNGGYLYQNGGNMFYARLVRMNCSLYHLLEKFT